MVTKLERIEYVEDPHLGKGSYCVVERHADGGACSVPDYAVIKIFRHIVQGEGPDTIVRGSTRPSRRCRRPVYGRPCVRPPVGAPSSPFPTASMRVLAAGLWRSGPGVQPRRPWGLRGCKKPGKETVDSAAGFCYDGLWSKKTYFSHQRR